MPAAAFVLTATNDSVKVEAMSTVDATFRFLSVAEAAEILGVTGGRVRQLLIARELPGHKLGGAGWAIPERAVKRFQAAREKKSMDTKPTGAVS